MRGQWLGRYDATPNGSITINIDELATCYEGTAYLHPNETPTGLIPKSQVIFRTSNKATDQFSFSTPHVFPLHPFTHEPQPWEQIKHFFAPDAYVSKRVDVTGRVLGAKLHLSWKNENGLGGRCSLDASRAKEQSELAWEPVTWEHFKSQAIRLAAEKKFIFRGQSKPWRLRTSYHRNGRSDLRRFVLQDMPQLHQVLSGRTRHYFDLRDNQQYAAFLSLSQHHGYPTPLLDWTRSPFVAAFFAYRGVEKSDEALANEKVRIHVFDIERWQATSEQILSIVSPLLHLSFVDVLALENERLIPQQAVALISSVDDIEGYLSGRERNHKIPQPYLRAFDLPASERDLVFRELESMGITAGSLFPGLDGSCEALKERNFPRM